jgi:hypothetical protein
MDRNIKLIITKKESINKSFYNFDFINNINIFTYEKPKYIYINNIFNDCKSSLIKYLKKYLIILIIIYLIFI